MRRLLLLVFSLLLAGAAWMAFSLYRPYQGFPKEGVFVDIPRRASGRAIAHLLAEKGVVRSPLAFEALCRWRSRRRLVAGEYFFDLPANELDVFRKIAEGRVYVKDITIPEGYTMFDIADLVAREGFTTREAFLKTARDPSPIRDLAPSASSLEGFLFPATYQFSRRVSAQDIVAAMVARFREAWNSLPEETRNRGDRPVDAVVTLASLVEKETSLASERPIIAGVFVNRLRRDQALQCDPTVIYALQLADKYSGRLDSGDLWFDSPYNTYRRRGLPPGPIANPGLASLRAALVPEQVGYLYFVANGRGGHSFGRTLKEHNENVTRYRHLLPQNGHEPDPEVADNGNKRKIASAQKRPR